MTGAQPLTQTLRLPILTCRRGHAFFQETVNQEVQRAQPRKTMSVHRQLSQLGQEFLQPVLRQEVIEEGPGLIASGKDTQIRISTLVP